MKNYYIFIATLIFIFGIIFASLGIFRHIPSYLLAIFILLLFGFLVLSLKRDFLFITILCLLIFTLGASRYGIFNISDENHIRNFTPYLQKKVLIQGKIVNDPEKNGAKNKETFTLEAKAIKLDNSWRITNGLVLVNIYDKRESIYQYGDILVLEGFLKRPFFYRKQANFDYKKFLANKRIYSMLNVKKGFFSGKIAKDKRITTQIVRVIYFIREKLKTHIEEFLDPPYSSVLIAILLGKREGITPFLRDLFAKTGTLHILAISGLHIGVIYFALKVILKIFRMKKNPSIILCVSFLILYAILTGARPSILRATTMFSIFAFGEILKRRINIYNLIGLSSFIVLMINPNQLFDISFILSYMAVLSIVSISPKIYQLFSAKNRIMHYLLRSISVSLAAWIGLLPLIAYYFGLLSPIIVIANLIVVPLLFVIMGSGFLLVSLGFLSTFLATIFSQSIWFFLVLLINSVKFLKNIPWSYFEIKPPCALGVFLYYTFVLILIHLHKAKKPTFLFLT